MDDSPAGGCIASGSPDESGSHSGKALDGSYVMYTTKVRFLGNGKKSREVKFYLWENAGFIIEGREIETPQSTTLQSCCSGALPEI
jgi:hypothetical protein